MKSACSVENSLGHDEGNRCMGNILKALVASWLIRKLLPVILGLVLIIVIIVVAL